MRRARPWCVLSSVLVLSFTSLGQPGQAQTPSADAVLAATRTALGGGTRIAAVKSVIANGRTRQVRGDNLVPIEFEIQIELPDKYSRRDEIPAQDTDPATVGFNGNQLVLVPPPPPPVARAGGPPPPSPEQQAAARAARVVTLKQDLTRLMLGWFATPLESYPVRFDYVGQAEAPQGKADVIDVTGAGNFAARLFIDSATHLPIMLSWRAPAPPARGGGPPPGAAAGAGPAAPPEQRLYFADYRDVDGLKLPFRIRRASGADTTEETTFDRFRINARTDPRRFEPVN